MRLKYTAEARIDLLEALTYYEEQQEGLAVDFHKELIRAEKEITANPNFRHPLGDGLRRKHFRRYSLQLDQPNRAGLRSGPSCRAQQQKAQLLAKSVTFLFSLQSRK